MGEFDYRNLNDVIHGRVRLAVMTFLATVEQAEFAALREAVGVTDGNLSTHLRKLEEAGYVAVDKSFVNRRPLTRVSLTEAGRKAFLDYMDGLEAMVRASQALKGQE